MKARPCIRCQKLFTPEWPRHTACSACVSALRTKYGWRYADYRHGYGQRWCLEQEAAEKAAVTV
jgi:hypothetical protein